MAKKNISRIAAIALAGATVVSTLAVSASAASINTDGKMYGNVYLVTTQVENAAGVMEDVKTYYANEDDAKATGAKYSSVNVTTLGSTVYVEDGKVYQKNPGSATEYKTTGSSSSTGSTTGSTTGVIYAYKYASDYVYYSYVTNTYYPNLAALRYAEGNHISYDYKTPATSYSSVNCYFDPVTGTYHSYALSSSAYQVAPNSNISYSTPSTSYRYPSAYSYYSYTTGMYYPNLNALKNVEGSNATYKTVTPATGYSSVNRYFNPATGSYTSTASTSSSYAVDSYYYNYYGYYNGYYGNYGVDDPYFYYFLNKDYFGTSSSNKDTTTATLGNRKGWTSIAKYLKGVASGSTATIDMNKETVVPADVMAAIKGRNVTIKLVLDNGVTFTINGKDVSTAKDVDIDTTYNTRSISKNLIKAAYKKNDAVSSSQLAIDAGSFGFNSDVTVKFNSKRGGYKAKLYRYNAGKNSLQLVDTATIGSTGKCNFDNVTKGGEFVIVIYK